MLPVLANMQLAQATSLQDHTVGHKHSLNVHVRPVSSMEKGHGKQEVGERRSISSTQLWPKATTREEPERRRSRSSELFRCRLMCQVNENQTVQRWMPRDCR